MMLIQSIRDELSQDPEGCWDWVQKTRKLFVPEVFMSKPADRLSFDRSVNTTIRILRYLEDEISLDGMCPGHGPGHWMRDYISACQLLSDPETILGRTETEVLAGFAGGILHDIGNAVVDRYHDGKTPVRHAEVSGLLLARMFEREDFGLTEAEQLAIEWAVMAHTHYLRPQEIKWGEQMVTIEPYMDSLEDGTPLYGVWFPRMIDRLDCSGSATFVARHYLTLYKDHQDFSSTTGFYDVVFHDHIQPLLRTPEEIRATGGKQTMLEHLRMFANSQTHDSPYGKHDYGRMIPLRDAKRENLLEFVSYVGQGIDPQNIDTSVILERWTAFLSFIEPSESGCRAAGVLNRLLEQEAEDVQAAWAFGFEFSMHSYQKWGKQVINELSQIGVPFELPFVGDIRNFLEYDSGRVVEARSVAA